MVKLVLKNRKDLVNIFIATDSDLENDTNKFYLSISGTIITVNGYSEEENVFTCLEYPDYVIPLSFISHKYQILINGCNNSINTFGEIAVANGLSQEGVRKIFNRTIKKIKNIMDTNSNYKEYFCE